MVEAVCFDLDNTLCVGRKDDREIHDAVFARIEVDPFFEPADVHAVDPASLPPADSDAEFYEHLYRAVAENVGGDPGHAPALAEATVEVLDDGTDVVFRDGAEEALAYARRNYDVGLLTVGNETTQRDKLAALGVADAFDAVVICGRDTGVEPKPDPEPFRRVLAELDADPGETVYVGDSLDGDVAGAREVGMESAWVPAEGAPADLDPEPTYRLDSIADLPSVL